MTSKAEIICFRATTTLRIGDEEFGPGYVFDPREWDDSRRRGWIRMKKLGDVEEVRLTPDEIQRIKAEREAKAEFEAAKREAREELEEACAKAREEYEHATAEAERHHNEAVAEARVRLDRRLDEIHED